MPSRRLVKDPERYKTVLCATWTSAGECPYGRKCQFAHGKEELRARTAPAIVPRMPGVMQPPLPPHMSAMRPLPQAPMSMWPAGPSMLHSQLAMPPLPLGPPPSAGNLMGSAPLAAPSLPPLPPGPPPASMAPGALPFDGPSLLHGAYAAQTAARAGMPMMAGAMDGRAMMAELLHAGAPSAAPAAAQSLPAALLAQVNLPAPPAMAPAADPPLAGTYPAPSDAQQRALHAHAQLLATSRAAQQLAAALAPAPEPPVANALGSATAAGTAGPVAQSAAPGTATARGLSTAEELACFAMKCHVAERGPFDDNALPEHPPRIWSEAAPLRCHPHTGKVEAVDGVSLGLGIRVPSQLSDGRLTGLDSPLDGGPSSLTSKGREVSFSTLLVRRAVSFIFDDPLLSPTLEPRLPSGLSCSSPRLATQSPHTAIAA